ncbi:MAG: amidohydrolase family protein [Pseudomonadota bacterium]
MPIDQEWLDQVKEEALDPDLPIIDPHHHLWDYPRDRYMLDELLADIDSGHNIVATVYVEASSMYRADAPEHLAPVGETEFANGIGAQGASGSYGDIRPCKGIVSFADLTLGAAVDEVLEAHLAVAPDRLRGIRHSVAWDSNESIIGYKNSPEGLMADARFREGFSRLRAHDLTFDAWLYHPQVPELTALARAEPDVTIIFDHFGGPLGIGSYEGRRDEVFAQWKVDIAALAGCPNVVAKIGGLWMALNGYDWQQGDKPPASSDLAEASRDWFLHTIDLFGPYRCMFESNFPVDKVSCSYGVMWNAFKRMAEGFSADERRAIFHDTAARVYRLD